jgi:hypothetical protein
VSEQLLRDGERERLARLATSGSPDEWAAASHAGEILKCLDKGIVPSPEAIQWFLTQFRKQTP